MKQSKAALGFTRAIFPFLIACIALVLFVIVYFYITVYSIDPRYVGNLIFALPFVCFGLIALFTAKGKIGPDIAAVLTGVLIVVLGIAMLLVFGHRVLQEATAVVTDPGKYERVLKLSGYPESRLVMYYPKNIPDNAENVLFSYNPAFMQGGKNIELKFDTDADSISKYADRFSHLAGWSGRADSAEAEKRGIFSGDFSIFGYQTLPADFTVYLLYSMPYRPGDWNHGEVSLVAISKERREILFHAEDW